MRRGRGVMAYCADPVWPAARYSPQQWRRGTLAPPYRNPIAGRCVGAGSGLPRRAVTPQGSFAPPHKKHPIAVSMREFCSRSYFGAVLTDPFPCIRKTVLCQPTVLYPPIWTSGSSVSSFVRLASGDQSLISLPLSLNVVSSVRLASGDMSMILL